MASDDGQGPVQAVIEKVAEKAQEFVVMGQQRMVDGSCRAFHREQQEFETFGHKVAVVAGVFIVVFLAFIGVTIVGIYRKSVWRDGKVGVFLPLYVYDLMAVLFFPSSFLISSLMYFQPTESEWNNSNNFIFNGPEALKTKGGSSEDMKILKSDILEGKSKVYSEIEIVKLFDSLPTCKPALLMGRAWDGRIIRTNKNLLDLVQVLFGSLLHCVGITWGRRFISHHRGDPIVLNICNRVFIPFAGYGNMSIETSSWREVSTAAGRFNSLPWTDYFRVLKEEGDSIVLLCCWTNREKTGGWFTLTLNKAWPLASTAPFS